MGFTTGFTGGVTLTLGIAYLTILSHQRNRQTQAQLLRSQSYLLNSILDPVPPPLPPTRAELAAAARKSFTETLKTRWNEEVQSAVRTVHNTDWDDVRENMEDSVARLWTRAFGRVAEGTEMVEERMRPVVDDVVARGKNAASNTAESVSVAARRAVEMGQVTGSQVAAVAGGRVDEAKDAVVAVVQEGTARGMEMAAKAQTAIGTAGETVETAFRETAESSTSDVEKILRQRYDGPRPVEKTVDEVLQERYVPLDKRSDTILRGV